jgi:hypothetical protein
MPARRCSSTSGATVDQVVRILVAKLAPDACTADIALSHRRHETVIAAP